MKTFLLAIAFIAFAMGERLNAAPYLMGALGDSITAATFADGSAVPIEGNRFDEPPELQPLNRVPFLGEMENKNTFSWASGQKIQSHFLRLNQWLTARGATVWMLNVAVPGAMTKDLDSQVTTLLNEVATGRYAGLKYVTLLIGANDACSTASRSGTPNSSMARDIRNALARLASIRQSETIKILVSSLPKIPDLGREEILNLTTVAGLSCQFVRDQIARECPSLIHWQTAEDYAERLAVVDQKNALLAKIASDANAQFPSLSVVYNDRFYRETIKPEYLARDCFHPNSVGQETLSRELWEDQPWFK